MSAWLLHAPDSPSHAQPTNAARGTEATTDQALPGAVDLESKEQGWISFRELIEVAHPDPWVYRGAAHCTAEVELTRQKTEEVLSAAELASNVPFPLTSTEIPVDVRHAQELLSSLLHAPEPSSHSQPGNAEPGPEAAAAYALFEAEDLEPKQQGCASLLELVKMAHSDPWVYRGAALCAAEVEPARRSIETALSAAEPSGNVWYARGLLARLDKDPVEAERLLFEALGEEPHLALAWTELGAVYYQDRHYLRAEFVLDLALQLEPELELAKAQRLRVGLADGALDRLLHQLDEIPLRWASIPAPRVASSGRGPDEVLAAAEEEDLLRARAFIEALVRTPLEERRDFLSERLGGLGLTEVDLWFPLRMARAERKISSEEWAIVIEAWLQLSEAAGRRDILWQAADEIAKELSSRCRQAKQELGIENWLHLEAPTSSKALQAGLVFRSAMFLLGSGSNEQSLSAYRRAREVYESIGDHLGQGHTWDGEARALSQLGQYQQALSAYRVARDVYRSAGHLLGQGNTWYGEARVLFLTGYGNEAIAAFREARQLFSRVDSRVGQGNAWNGEADALFFLGRNEVALTGYRKAREIHRAVNNCLGEGDAWIGEARVLLRSGQVAEALATYRQTRKIFQAVGSPMGEGGTWIGEARALARLGRNQQALAAFRRAQGLYDLCTGGRLLAPMVQAWAEEADVLVALGQNQEALSFTRSARSSYRDVGNRAGEASTWNTEATVLFRWSRFEEALAAHRKARELSLAIGDPFGQGRALSGEARTLFYLGQNEKALIAYREARKLYQAVGFPLGQGNTWEGEARVFAHLGRSEEALIAYRSARKLFQDAGSEQGVGDTWQGEAALRLEERDWEGAYQAGQNAESLIRTGEAPWSMINALEVQALALEKLNHPRRVSELAMAMIDIFDGLRGGLFFDIQRTELEAKIHSTFDLLMGALLDLDDLLGAFELAERARSQVLVSLLRFPFFGPIIPPAGESREQIGVPSAASLEWPGSLSEGFDALSLVAIQAVVDAAGPVLYFFGAKEETLAAFLRPGQPPSIERLEVGQSELATFTRDFANLVANPNYGDRYREKGATLADLLLAPFLDQLPPAGPLLIVPHGPLHQLPFDALLDKDGRLLGERFDLTVVPSLSAISEARSRHHRSSPDDFLFTIAAGEGLARPRAEIQSIIDIFGIQYPPGFEPELADITAYRERARWARHLLVATQGAHEPNSLSGTYLEIEATDDHDGRLSAVEIAGLPLEAELVTLAACDTARGKSLLSDERLDLTRAFLIAGAAAVLASLWKIPEDRSTSRFLTDFYRAYRKGGPEGKGLRKDEALAHAKRLSRERGDPAQVWAAWVLVGDPR